LFLGPRVLLSKHSGFFPRYKIIGPSSSFTSAPTFIFNFYFLFSGPVNEKARQEEENKERITCLTASLIVGAFMNFFVYFEALLWIRIRIRIRKILTYGIGPPGFLVTGTDPYPFII
jgi:hypothetical protein